MKKVLVALIFAVVAGAAAAQSVESQIRGEFKGWTGQTVYELMNGQVWQQSEFRYHYHYAYSPRVVVFQSDYGYKMIVLGDDGEPISVRRLR